PAAASTTPLTSAAGAVQAGQETLGERQRRFGAEEDRPASGGGSPGGVLAWEPFGTDPPGVGEGLAGPVAAEDGTSGRLAKSSTATPPSARSQTAQRRTSSAPRRSREPGSGRAGGRQATPQTRCSAETGRRESAAATSAAAG